MSDEVMEEQGQDSDRTIAVESAAVQLVPAAQAITLPLLEHVWHQTLGWQPTALHQEQFQRLYDLILAGNRQLNLTRITEPAEFWEKHLWDSLRGVKDFLPEGEVQRDAEMQRRRDEGMGRRDDGESSQLNAQNQDLTTPSARRPNRLKVIDIGTGAGFPGIPVAIAQPTWTITLLDATRKKIHFLEQLLASLQMTNATPLVARVEQLGRQKGDRQTYDLALIRAVAPASVCAEYALPLLKIGGSAVLYRGQWTDAETESLTAASATLGGKIDAIDAFTTPLTHSDRHCLYIKKIAPTPAEFPRAIGIPTQKPL